MLYKYFTNEMKLIIYVSSYNEPIDILLLIISMQCY